MNADSMRLVLAGGMIGMLVLSAAAWRAVRGPWAKPASPASDPEAVMAASGTKRMPGDTEEGFGEAAVPIFAVDAAAAAVESETADGTGAGPFVVALRVTEAVWGEKLFVCDGKGCPLEEIIPDRDGDQSLGPLAPGRYGVFRGETEIGTFRLCDNAALSETGGRLWTDGELLYVERFVPGTARLDLTLQSPGYYSLRICDRVGRTWSRDLYVPESDRPNRGGAYRRTLEFRGLPAGLYTVVYGTTPLGQVEVTAGETTELTVQIEG